MTKFKECLDNLPDDTNPNEIAKFWLRHNKSVKTALRIANYLNNGEVDQRMTDAMCLSTMDLHPDQANTIFKWAIDEMFEMLQEIEGEKKMSDIDLQVLEQALHFMDEPKSKELRHKFLSENGYHPEFILCQAARLYLEQQRQSVELRGLDDVKFCTGCGILGITKLPETAISCCPEHNLKDWSYVNDLESRLSAVTVPEWMPIESAPRDGTDILVGRPEEKEDGVTYYGYVGIAYQNSHPEVIGKWINRDNGEEIVGAKYWKSLDIPTDKEEK